jgi:hypothetical protein
MVEKSSPSRSGDASYRRRHSSALPAGVPLSVVAIPAEV